MKSRSATNTLSRADRQGTSVNLEKLMRWFKRLPTQPDVPADSTTFVSVGYPKVGNTWVRLMIGRYLQLAYSLADLPLMELDEKEDLDIAGCRAVGSFTHEPLDWHDQTAADLNFDNVVRPFIGRRVLFLTRYPIDVLVSLYMQTRYRTGHEFSGSLVQMFDDPVFGLDKLIKFHQLWADHHKSASSFMICRYEDLLTHPKQVFADILYYLGEVADAEIADQALSFSSFDNMKSLESSENGLKYKSSQLNIFATGDRSEPNAFHVRKGKIRGYKDDLDEASASRFEQRVNDEFPSLFGYY